MIRPACLLSLALALAPACARAELALPAGAALRFEVQEQSAAYALPIGGHDGDTLPVIRTEGAVIKRAFRVGGTGMSSFQLMLGLRQQLIDQGYDILFECDEVTCGGYDFRFATDVIAEPEMHVDLGDFQFISAHVPGDSGMFATALVSKSASAGFVQIVEVSPAGSLPEVTVTSTKAQTDREETFSETAIPAAVLGDIGGAMEAVGRYVLADLVFESGSSALGEGTYESLGELAAYLAQNPDKRVALVGHTDAQGALANNITLSRRRAESVMARLVDTLGVNPAQLEADGVGYLSPLATNQTEEGRTRNRRVEAILVSTD